MKQRHHQHRKPRNAAVLICVLACLMVVMGLVLSLTRSASQARRETRLRLQMRQTEYLLDAGVMRAVRRLRESNDYTGEQWRPRLERFAGAVVHIKLATDSTDPNQSSITVSADLGGDEKTIDAPNVNRTHRQRTLTIPIPEANSLDAE